MSNNEFHKDNEHFNIERLRTLLSELPQFSREYFRGLYNTTSVLTRVNYAYDLRLFFNFLINEIILFRDCAIKTFSFDDMNKITAEHIEMFLEYVTYYRRGENFTPTENHQSGKARKLSTLRSYFSFYFKRDKIFKNVTEIVEMPRIHEKPIIRLDTNEVADLLDNVESGKGLTDRQKKINKKNRLRDMAILTLFLSTGVRLSECIGIDIDDVDFNNNGIRVTRKGGHQEIVYFGLELESALRDYMEERKKITAVEGHQSALFLSLQRKRISTRAVQEMVKKFARITSPLKKISPHKLRSTYGTNLYKETGDIYLVAEVLGHKDINTTRRHYAAMEEEKRRLAAKAVKLRD